jgi:hypothetical protein
MSSAQPSSSSRNRDQTQPEAPLGIEKFHRISGKKGLGQGWKGHSREEFRQEFRRHPGTSAGFAGGGGGGGRGLSEFSRVVAFLGTQDAGLTASPS